MLHFEFYLLRFVNKYICEIIVLSTFNIKQRKVYPVYVENEEEKKMTKAKKYYCNKLNNDDHNYVDPTPYKLSKTNQILVDVLKTIIIPVVLSILWHNEL